MCSPMKKRAMVWLRRDLRIEDHTAWFHASHDAETVLPVFVLDASSFESFLPGKKPFGWFMNCLLALRADLRKQGKELYLLEGDPVREIPEFCRTHLIESVHFNKDYEPESIERDKKVTLALQALGVSANSYKDQVLFEEREILNGSGEPYRVFTAYKNQYFKRAALTPPEVLTRSLKKSAKIGAIPESRASESAWRKVEALAQEGEKEAHDHLPKPGESAAKKRLAEFIAHRLVDYPDHRNLPAIPGSARISPDLRAGTLSPRQVWTQVRNTPHVKKATQDQFLSEVAWRDFFMAVGFNFPRVYHGNFNAKYDRIEWRGSDRDFKAWCEGKTGYPIVDAGMRELVRTGFMHNRVRMITAMFLVKDLLIDWRRGEKFFLEHLIDGDRAVNNGNWQWCASTGCDAQPYFRIFNPRSQSLRFDTEGEYIRLNVPELRQLKGKAIHGPTSQAIVDHSMAYNRCIQAYKKA